MNAPPKGKLPEISQVQRTVESMTTLESRGNPRRRCKQDFFLQVSQA